MILRRTQSPRPFASALLACLALSGCNDGSLWSGSVPTPDFASFESDVYPVLLHDCAFSRCHGGPDRFFRVLGPGRARLRPETAPGEPATEEEIAFSYARARSMLADAARPEDSLLLRKPLEPAAGGQGHEGVDSFGRNVFASRSAPGYLALLAWSRTMVITTAAISGTDDDGGSP